MNEITPGAPGHLDEHMLFRAYMEGRPVKVATDALGRYAVQNYSANATISNILQNAYNDTVMDVLARTVAPSWGGRSRKGSRRDNQRKRGMKNRRAGKPSYRTRQNRGRAARFANRNKPV